MRLANGIVIIAFKNPVDVAVDRIPLNSGGYIGAARRDPDGAGIRLALTRKVTVNSMAAGEKFFVDLLPEGWAGLPPGLPQEVVDDLARRAREADKKMRQQQKLAALKQQPPVRVRVGAQPTFTRYMFELPGLVPVANNRVDDTLTLTFDAPLRFDLADAQSALPPSVGVVEVVQRCRSARGALRAARQGGCPHVPRGQQLRRRHRARSRRARCRSPRRTSRPTSAPR